MIIQVILKSHRYVTAIQNPELHPSSLAQDGRKSFKKRHHIWIVD
jgi:hypothetical protein